jgi:hypothetical protein
VPKQTWVNKRRMAAHIYMELGWMTGAFHVDEGRYFTEWINRPVGFIPLTDALIPKHEQAIPFFALQKDAAHLIVPNEDDDQLEPAITPGGKASRPISCLLSLGVVNGEVHMISNMRVSDFLTHHPGFFILRNCTSSLWQSKEPASSPPVAPVVIINAHHVIGVTEMSAP